MAFVILRTQRLVGLLWEAGLGLPQAASMFSPDFGVVSVCHSALSRMLLALLLCHSDVPVWSFPFTSYSHVTSLGTYVRDKRKEELHVSSSS